VIRTKYLQAFAAGLASFFNIDPVLLRVVWLLVVIFTGVVPGTVAYILASFIIPNHTHHIHQQ